VLDTKVFVFAIEFPNSNCEGVTGALALGLFDGYVTDRVLYEGMTYFKRHHSRDDAARFHRLATTACHLVLDAVYKPRMDELGDEMNRKDAPQLAAARTLGIPHVVSTDSDFEGIAEWVTPKQFLALLGLKPRRGDM
jgi:predicted nucleic acid-binding protein